MSESVGENVMQRSAFLTSAAAAAITPAFVSAQTLTTINVASSYPSDVIGLLWGIESGAFHKAGLDVRVQKLANGAAIAAAVLGGSVDVGQSSLVPLMQARVKNLPLVLVAPGGITTNDAPVLGLVRANGSPIHSGKDVNGATIGVMGLNDITVLGAEAWVDATGGDSKTLRYVEIPPAAMADAVASGRVAAGTMTNPTFHSSIQTGKVSLLANSLTAIAPRFMASGYFSTTDFIAKHRAALAAYRRVIEESNNYANTHHEQMVPILAKYTGIEVAVLAGSPAPDLALTLDPKLIRPLVAAAIKYKMVPPDFDEAAMIDPRGT